MAGWLCPWRLTHQEEMPSINFRPSAVCRYTPLAHSILIGGESSAGCVKGYQIFNEPLMPRRPGGQTCYGRPATERHDGADPVEELRQPRARFRTSRWLGSCRH